MDFYWVTRVDEIRSVLLGIIVISFIIAIVNYINCQVTRDDNRLSKVLVIIAFFSMGIRSFIPTTNDLILMDVLPKILKNENVDRDLKEIVTNYLELKTGDSDE